MQNHWSSRKPSKRTKDAEEGLGIAGSPHYFYVMRTERAFGFAVFFFRENPAFHWPIEAYGASPFDTGGLWHGHIYTRPPIDPDERKRLFVRSQIPLSRWKSVFEEYVAKNYASLADYVTGSCPRVGVDSIVLGPPNTSRAWTWELRVPNSLMHSSLELLHGFLSEDDHDKYLDWLWSDSALDDAICRHIQLWMQDNMTFAPPGVSALKLAQSELM